MSEAWPDTYNEGYISQFQPDPITEFTSSSRSTAFKDILPWNISQIITKTIPIGMRIWAMQWNKASHFEFIGKSIETETTTWSEFSNGRKAIVEQILVSEERNKFKRAGLCLFEYSSGIEQPRSNYFQSLNTLR